MKLVDANWVACARNGICNRGFNAIYTAVKPDNNIEMLGRSRPVRGKLEPFGSMILRAWLRFRCYEKHAVLSVEL